MLETTNVDFDLYLENNYSERKVMARLIDASTVVHAHNSGLSDWASRITPEVHVVLLLPNDDAGEQTLALQMLQLQ